MLSGIPVSPGVTSSSSSSGLSVDVVTCCWSERGFVSIGWAESPDFLHSVDVPFSSQGLPGGDRVFPPSTENGLLPVAGVAGFPEVDI